MQRPLSSFVESKKQLFQDVSRLNLKRAEQIRKQFSEKRKLTSQKFNENYANSKA